MKRSPMPRRTTGLARTGRLALVSAKHRAGQQAQQAAYAAADDAGAEWCAACGATGTGLEHAHLYTQKLYPQHRNNQLNWLLLCAACHRCQENNKPLFAKKYPAAWAESIRRMRLVDLQAYDFYAATLPELYPD